MVAAGGNGFRLPWRNQTSMFSCLEQPPKGGDWFKSGYRYRDGGAITMQSWVQIKFKANGPRPLSGGDRGRVVYLWKPTGKTGDGANSCWCRINMARR